MAEALEEDDHLGSEEIAAYVAGRMDEVARVCAQSHLECCEMCFREVRELRAWVSKMNLTRLGGEGDRGRPAKAARLLSTRVRPND